MKYFCVFLILVSLSVFNSVISDLYFGSNNRTCYEANDTLYKIKDICEIPKVNRTNEDFRDYTAYNPQQCQSRSSNLPDGGECCLFKIKYEEFSYNFCGQVTKEEYDNIPGLIDNILEQNKTLSNNKKDIKIDCESNYNKIFSFAFLLMIVLIL